jgi:hypothetical protein
MAGAGSGLMTRVGFLSPPSRRTWAKNRPEPRLIGGKTILATPKQTAGGRPQSSKQTTDDNDPLKINFRLYSQIGKLLDDLEREDRDEVMTTPQRIQALIAVGRILTIFAALKKNDYNYGNTGSAVRKYAAAFQKPYAVGGRAHGPGSAEPVDFDSSSDEYDA